MKNNSPNLWQMLFCIFLGSIIGYTLSNFKQGLGDILFVPNIKENAGSVTDTVSPLATTSDIVQEPAGCESTEVKDYILFLSRGTGGKLDLHIMDKNACNHHVVMRNVSGGPEWSGDGKHIFVGCEHARSICVIDAHATLNPCLGIADMNECTPVIEKIYTVPAEILTPKYITASWSKFGKKLLVTIQADLFDTYVYFLALEKDDWQLIGKNALMSCDLSPLNDDLICDGIEKINLREGFFDGLHVGSNPKWSPDGKNIVFLFYQIQDKEYSAETIMEWTFDSEKHWRILREPDRSGQYAGDSLNNIFNIGSFSWSPDKKFIVFTGNYGQESQSLIFRLDTHTGQVVVLTNKIGDGFYHSPAWGYLP